jgi:alpha-ketoglutarate-dependent taurine dioxygenase
MLVTLTFQPEESPENVAAAFLDAWPSAKVVHIKGPRPGGDVREFYTRFFELVGYPLGLAEDATIGDRNAQRTGEVWFEVRYDPAVPDAYRHSANAQPLHTDGSYIPNFPNAGFLACQSMPDEGGATTFVDSESIVAALRSEAPELLKRLETLPIPHSRSGDRRVEPAIRWYRGEPLVNWNYYCVDASAGAEVLALREAFSEFLRSSPDVQADIERVKLAPGEAVLWKDDRVLHGRDSFDAKKKSDRFLWKAALQVTA